MCVCVSVDCQWRTVVTQSHDLVFATRSFTTSNGYETRHDNTDYLEETKKRSNNFNKTTTTVITCMNPKAMATPAITPSLCSTKL